MTEAPTYRLTRDSPESHTPMRLSLMTFNISLGGTWLGQPLSQTLGVVRETETDVLVLQEWAESAEKMGVALGFQLHVIDHTSAIISR